MVYSNVVHSAFLLILLTCRHLGASVSSYTFEGFSCELGDKTFGICQPIKSCPPALKEVMEQIIRRTRAGKRKYPRCGFDGFAELVCCPHQKGDVTASQPLYTSISVTNEMPIWTVSKPTEIGEPSKLPVTHENGHDFVVPSIVGRPLNANISSSSPPIVIQINPITHSNIIREQNRYPDGEITVKQENTSKIPNIAVSNAVTNKVIESGPVKSPVSEVANDSSHSSVTDNYGDGIQWHFHPLSTNQSTRPTASNFDRENEKNKTITAPQRKPADQFIHTQWPNYQSNSGEEKEKLNAGFNHEWKPSKKITNHTKQPVCDQNKPQIQLQENTTDTPNNTIFPVIAGEITAPQPPYRIDVTNEMPIWSASEPTNTIESVKYPLTHKNGYESDMQSRGENPLNANISSSSSPTVILINSITHSNIIKEQNRYPDGMITVKPENTSKIPNVAVSNAVTNVIESGPVKSPVYEFENDSSYPNVTGNYGDGIQWHFNPLSTNQLTRPAVSNFDRENEKNKTQANKSSKNITTPLRKADRACAEYLRDAPQSIHIYILDGESVSSGEFPHMVALGYDNDDGSELSWACGGSLVSDRFVLTAARCVLNAADIPPSVARIGTVSLSDNYDATDTDYDVDETFVHPSFKYSVKYYDVALIRLKKAVVITANAHPACLYTSDADPKENLIITGWGQTSFTKADSASKTLLKANVSAVPLTECAPLYADQRFKKPLPYGLTSDQLCAVDKDGHADACFGDAGGPLQLDTNVDGVFKLVGITSFGMKCGDGNPGVYMRVSRYLDWIESIVWP